MENMPFVKFKRGSVWFYQDNEPTKQSSVQHFSRPVIIVSNDKFNTYAPCVNVLPLTTKSKNNCVHVNVPIVGTNNTSFNCNMNSSEILTEQIKTVDIKNLTEYLGMVDESIIDKIDEKLLYQLNILKFNALMKDEIKNYIDIYVKNKIRDLKQININEFVNQIQENVDKIISDETKAMTNVDIPQNKSSFAGNIIKSDKKNKIVTTSNKRGRKSNYDINDAKFIVENYKINKNMLMEKYNKDAANISKLHFYLKKKFKL